MKIHQRKNKIEKKELKRSKKNENGNKTKK